MKRFNMIDEAFVCEACGKKIKPLGYTARDHCPYCLHSKHVDINPGDRLESCHGILKPIGVEKGKKTDYKIIYECQKCHKIRRNVSAKDDNFDEIIKISTNNN